MNDVIIITNPMIAANESTKVTLSKFIRVIEPSYQELRVIGGNLHLEDDLKRIQLISTPIQRNSNKIKRILDITALQFKMSLQVLSYVKKGQPVFFWIGDKMILPFFFARIKHAQINYFIYGNPEKEGNTGLFSKISAHLIRLMAQRADYVCMESPSVKNEWTGLRVKKQKIIHLYTEIVPMSPIDKRENVIGMICRLTAGKHVLESIQAFSEFRKSHSDWKLEIVGSGVQENDCRKLIQDLELEGIVVLHGWVNHDDIRKITKKWMYLLFPSDTEGMPNSVIEMMAQGTPVIASSVGGICDIIQQNKTGWIIDSCSKQGIKDAMEQAIRSKNYDKIALEAQNIIIKNFELKAAQMLAEL